MYLDGDQGTLVAFETPTGQYRGRTITTWLYHLHLGDISGSGWPYRVFVALMGLGVAALSVTGVWIW